MSNTKKPFIEITPENQQNLRDQFCNEVGHSNDCVNETVHQISDHYRHDALSQGIHPAKYLDTVSIEEFDRKLRQLLFDKPCTCGKTTHLN